MPDNAAILAVVSGHRCSVCQKTFKNQSHLRRHESSHTNGQKHECIFCSRTFARPDALRRHFKTCSKVQPSDILPVSHKGRKPRACQKCKAKKVQCDGRQPCQRCLSGSSECSYSSSTDSNPVASHVPMTFLLNYTDPFLEAVSDAFPMSGAHAESAVEALPDPYTSLGTVQEGYIADLFSGIFSASSMDREPQPSNPAFGGFTLQILPALQPQVDAMISLLVAQYALTPHLLTVAHHGFPIDLAKTVLASHHIAEYVAAFFSFVHPHTPFIHQPSFDIENASTLLLLALTLMGSIFATPHDNALCARFFFDLAEEHVFAVLRKVVTEGEACASSDIIEIVQAAILMYSLQVNSNHEPIRHRMRVTRFGEVIAAMRRLQLLSINCAWKDGVRTWEQFIADEVKIRVFQTSCMSTLFFKSVPQITMAEMCGDMPSADALFEATTVEEFCQLVAGGRPKGSQSLKALIASFLSEDWDGPDTQSLAHLKAEHAVSIIFALHSIIFTSRTELLLLSSHQALLRATNRWRELWNHIYSRDGLSKKRLIGFTKYGLELWWLAQKILSVAKSRSDADAYMTGIPTDSLTELHDFIREYADS